MVHEYKTLISAARSIAYKNGVPLDIGMMWARQGVAGGQVVITGKITAPDIVTDGLLSPELLGERNG